MGRIWKFVENFENIDAKCKSDYMQGIRCGEITFECTVVSGEVWLDVLSYRKSDTTSKTLDTNLDIGAVESRFPNDDFHDEPEYQHRDL